MLDRPIFLSGLRKSGTSMVRHLLDGHPEIFMYPPNELHFFHFTHYFGRMKIERREQKPLGEVAQEMCENKWFRTDKGSNGPKYDRMIDFEQFHAELQAGSYDNYAELYEGVMKTMARAFRDFDGDVDTIRYAAKGVQQEEFFVEFLQMFPDLRFVYILRNPYAQFNSSINNLRHGLKGSAALQEINRDHRKLGKDLPYPYLGNRLREMHMSYYSLRKYSDLFPDNFYVLVYDRLLQDQDAEMGKLAKFLDIEFRPSLLECTNFGDAVVQKGWSVSGKHESSKMSTTPLEAWKEQLSPLAVRLINTYFRDVIDDYGFEFVRSDADIKKGFDRAEPRDTRKANQFLFTDYARRLV